MTAFISNNDLHYSMPTSILIFVPYLIDFINNNNLFYEAIEYYYDGANNSNQNRIYKVAAWNLASFSVPYVLKRLQKKTEQQVGISFHIMTRAEPTDMVLETIAALLMIKSASDEIIVVDNNHNDKALYEPLQAYCEGLDKSLRVRFIHQDHIPGFKAGALNLALKMTDTTCEYIVVVDSDYQALPTARRRIIEAIKQNPNHALLQFPQYYRDTDKPDIHSELNHYFTYHISRGLNRYYALSTGTFAVIKKDMLEQLGGWSGASITEDAQMGILMHQQGARSQFIPEVIATGLLPQTMSDLICQRQRWIYGNMQVLALYLRRSSHSRTHLFSQSQLKTSIVAQYDCNQGVSDVQVPLALSFATKVAHIRAHLSQLTAWVNFTGPFIGLHSAALITLAIAKLSNQPKAIPHVLTVLTVCYLAYALYLTRRLVAYLRDTRPLVAEPLSQQPERNTGAQSAAPPATNRSIRTSLIKTLVSTAAKLAPKRLVNIINKCFSRKQDGGGEVESNRKSSPPGRSAHTTIRSKSATKPLDARLRMWLVHLNFWEHGALSWLPVLWGQQKPFICTPKHGTSQSRLKSIMTNIWVTPKLLIVLNVLTAVLVRRHSLALLVCALSLLMIKLMAGWVIIANFVGPSAKVAVSDSEVMHQQSTSQGNSAFCTQAIPDNANPQYNSKGSRLGSDPKVA